MKFQPKFLLYVSILIAGSIGLYACSGSKATVTSSPEDGESLFVTDDIVLTFSKSMDVATLELDGNMADESADPVWSKTSKDNDTLTISPESGWDASRPGTLTVTVEDLTVELNYGVMIKLSKFQKADVVIGQPDFSTNSSGTSASKMSAPYGTMGFADGKLFLPDYSNNRGLIFNSIPTTNGKSANVVVGQNNFSSNLSGAAADEAAGPVGMLPYNGKLLTLEYDNNRMIIHNEIPTSNGEAANVVVGQNGFNLSNDACSSKRMYEPETFVVVDGKLIVADSGNNRILIWNEVPTTNGKAADLVLGQSTFNTCASNDDDQNGSAESGPSARTMDFPAGVWSDGKKVVVTDYYNSRVLIWNTFPTENFAEADVVLGQNAFNKKQSNDDDQDGIADSAPSRRTLSFPYGGVTSNGTQLFVGDSDNNRVLIWNTFPTENFAEADVVLGQNAFNKYHANDDDQDGASDATPSDRTLYYPSGLLLVGNQLFVAEASNNRVVVFNGQ